MSHSVIVRRLGNVAVFLVAAQMGSGLRYWLVSELYPVSAADYAFSEIQGFCKFCNSCPSQAASRKLEEFLKLMPAEDVAAAKEQVFRSSLPEEQLTI